MKTLRHILATTAIATSCLAAQAQVTVEPKTACTGQPVSIAIATSSDSQIAKVDFGDGYDTYGTKLQHIYDKDGTYSITVKIIDGSTDTDLTLESVTIGESPDLQLTDDQDNSLLVATATGGATFEWTLNGEKLQNTEPSLYYLESGTYSVTATNSNGCAETQSIKATYQAVGANDDTYIKVANNVITPSVRDGVNDVLYIEDVSNYPNPCSVKIFDKKGKLVYTNNSYSNTNGFQGRDDDGNDLFAGTYYYVIKSQGKKGCTGFVDIIR